MFGCASAKQLLSKRALKYKDITCYVSTKGEKQKIRVHVRDIYILMKAKFIMAAPEISIRPLHGDRRRCSGHSPRMLSR